MTTLNVDLSFTRPSVLRVLSRALAEIADINETDDRSQLSSLPQVSGSSKSNLAEDVTETELANAAADRQIDTADLPKRERGKPSPGKARRTKEEIAEDEAADKRETVPGTRYFIHPESGSHFTTEDGSRPVGDGLVEEVSAEQYAAYVAKLKPAISTGEERIDPTTTEDAAQDAADEAAEAEATKPAELTHDDVRAALKKYLDAYGTPAAMEDGPKVLKMLFGEGAAKVSDVPVDQASLAKAIAGIEEMLTKNPFKREAQL